MNIPATTIQEQLSILKNRNVRLDENSAGILLQYGYYNLINGYKDAFIDKNDRICVILIFIQKELLLSKLSHCTSLMPI